MTKDQKSKYAMYVVLQNYLNDPIHQEQLAQLPILGTIIEEFNSITAQITQKITSQESSLGTTQDKLLLQEELKNKAFQYSVFVSVYAKRNRLEGVFTDYKYQESDLTYASYDEFVVMVHKILTKTEELQAELVPYGFVAQEFEAFKSQFESFKTNATQTREIINSNKTLNFELKTLFAQNRDLIRNELDPLLKLFKVKDPIFYEGYENARKVHGLYRKKKEEPTPPPQEPEAPLNP